MVEPKNTAKEGSYLSAVSQNIFGFETYRPTFLDLGTGFGSGILRKLYGWYDPHVTGVDYYPENFEENRYCSRAVCSDVTRLGLKPSLFDLVIASELTCDNPFFDDPENVQAASLEIKRVLKPGGLFYMQNELKALVPEGFQQINRGKDETETRIFWALYWNSSLF